MKLSDLEKGDKCYILNLDTCTYKEDTIDTYFSIFGEDNKIMHYVLSTCTETIKFRTKDLDMVYTDPNNSFVLCADINAVFKCITNNIKSMRERIDIYENTLSDINPKIYEDKYIKEDENKYWYVKEANKTAISTQLHIIGTCFSFYGKGGLDIQDSANKNISINKIEIISKDSFSIKMNEWLNEIKEQYIK